MHTGHIGRVLHLTLKAEGRKNYFDLLYMYKKKKKTKQKKQKKNIKSDHGKRAMDILSQTYQNYTRFLNREPKSQKILDRSPANPKKNSNAIPGYYILQNSQSSSLEKPKHSRTIPHFNTIYVLIQPCRGF